MKLYSILIAFTFVSVVFAVDVREVLRDDYKIQVAHTNNHIRMISYQEKLQFAIKNIICGTEEGEYKFTMEDIVFMMAFLLEPLDEYTVPELRQLIRYQHDMQNELLYAANTPVPPLPPNYDYDRLLFPQLRHVRRIEIKEATISLILENIILPGPDFSEARLGDVCRLVGLFKSIINPESYIISADVDDLNIHCTLTDVNDNVSKYKPINGRIYQEVGDSDRTLSSEIMVFQFIRTQV